MKSIKPKTYVLMALSFGGILGGQKASAGFVESRSAYYVYKCAEPVKEGNLQATQDVLVELRNGELGSEQGYIALVDQYLRMESNEERIAFLRKSAGILTDAELAKFVGGREGEIPSNNIIALSQSAHISPEQSKIVLTHVAAALLGKRIN